MDADNQTSRAEDDPCLNCPRTDCTGCPREIPRMPYIDIIDFSAWGKGEKKKKRSWLEKRQGSTGLVV